MNKLIPRPYAGHGDLAAVHGILTDGRQAQVAGQPGSYYVHVGDVNWWLFYLNQDDDPRTHFFLWESAGRVVGWSLLSPAFRALDVFLLPSLRGTPEAAHMWAWTAARLLQTLNTAGRAPGPLSTMWVSEADDALIGLLGEQGYRPSPDGYLWHLESNLEETIPAPDLAAGFTVRAVAGEGEAEARALAAHGAFGSRQPVESYVEKYRRFMRSPVYADALDLVAVPLSPSGQPPVVAAFAVAWSDRVNGAGHFEPVGTHPRFQRQGLARAVLLEALGRLQASGLRSATVCVEADNPAALGLYASIGFKPVHKILTYAKAIPVDAHD